MANEIPAGDVMNLAWTGWRVTRNMQAVHYTRDTRDTRDTGLHYTINTWGRHSKHRHRMDIAVIR